MIALVAEAWEAARQRNQQHDMGNPMPTLSGVMTELRRLTEGDRGIQRELGDDGVPRAEVLRDLRVLGLSVADHGNSEPPAA